MAKRKKYVERLLKQRATLWPDHDDTDLWLRNDRDGFTTVPRNLSLICQILDQLSKGAPISSTYLELWCRVFDEGFVTINKPREMAYFSGFTGQRAERTWINRMLKLEELGFVKVASGSSGSVSFVLMLNPYHAIYNLKKNGHAGLTDAAYNALVTRAIEIGSTDIELYEEKLNPPQIDAMDDEIPF